jgi:aminoglycoside phosphotransferase (APT) family kinase protein
MTDQAMTTGLNPDALEAYLHEHVDGFQGPLEIHAFEAGQSNPTYKLETPGHTYVLRRKPDGKLLPSAHAVDREYRVMHALGQTDFPVPRMYLYAEEPDVVATPFYIMDFVVGRVFWNARLPDLTPEQRRDVFDAMNETMAKLHAIAPADVGLEDYGKSGNYFARQIGRWSKQYKASETESIEAMDKLIAWLPENIPADDETRIIHGDFGMHNLMFHPTETRIVAVLDWELSTLGHPIADLTYNMLPWYGPHVEGIMASFEGLDLTAHGVPSFDEYVNRYCEISGRPPLENPGFYRAYNLFRIAAILQGIVGRALQGNASNPNALQMRPYVHPLAERGWQEAQSAGAV